VQLFGNTVKITHTESECIYGVQRCIIPGPQVAVANKFLKLQLHL
jgi:hypothetical protein